MSEATRLILRLAEKRDTELEDASHWLYSAGPRQMPSDSIDVDEGECRASQVRNRLSSRTAVKASDGPSRCISTWRRTRQTPWRPTRADQDRLRDQSEDGVEWV